MPHPASQQQWDCIVIGAGMAGLTFATLAARSGKRVFAVEQHYLPGGCFTAFKKGPYFFNVALEWTTDCAEGEKFDRLLRELGVRDAYAFRRLKAFKSVLSPDLAHALRLPCGEQDLRASLVAAFPHQARGIDAFLQDCVSVVSDPGRAKTVLMKHGIKPVEQMLADYFDAPILLHSLYALIAYPGAKGVLLMYIVAAMCLDQLYVPAHHDHRKLAALLHREILRRGSQIAYSQSVARVLVENGKAIGVRLADGSDVLAPLVVAGIDGRQLYTELLDPDVCALGASDVLSRKPGLSSFCAFLGLNELPPLPSTDEIAYSVLAPLEEWRAAPSDLTGIPLRVEFQSVHYPKLAPRGGATACVWAATDISAFDYWGQGRERTRDEFDVPAYGQAKERATGIVLERLERAIPGIRDRISLVDAATPFTFKHYTRSQRGSVSGHSLSDMSYLKPGRHSTPIQSLYHIGHWTVQSGVNTAMYSAWALYRDICQSDSGTRAT